jgi:non-ribosomal peptide synthetase-like protein
MVNNGGKTVGDSHILTSADHHGGIRWQPGERLEQLFEASCDATGDDTTRRARRGGGNALALAVDGPAARLTYEQLDKRANRLARFLVTQLGIRPGDRIALLFDDPADGYAAMLGVLKARAVYVPLDPAFPAERLSYIVTDASVRIVLTHSRVAGFVQGAGVPAVCLDEAAAQIAAESPDRLTANTTSTTSTDAEELCYIIYTSGTTGRPKGVAITHASICNFVRVAAETYGYTSRDRVYQGLTMAFDFAVEEIWVPWMAGATLVPKPRGGSLLAAELSEFLRSQRITALCCVPTLLATLDDADLPGLRFLLVSGESCPRELADRWHRPGRRFLNVYGPTETTVSATWTLLRPGRPVTIGVPLPTYSVVILDPDSERVLPTGQTGEIGIAGVGLAAGYLNRPDRTASAFVPDFAGMPDNPSRRIYRTGDLGRVTEGGEIEHHGRIDTQVKIRGYRIELGEIESVLSEASGVAQAVASIHEPSPGVLELAAYYVPRQGASAGAASKDRLYEHLRARLPGYMVPAYLEELREIPVNTAGKADRANLPPPTHRTSVTVGEYAAPATETEKLLANALAAALDMDAVSADADFFDELGANSLLLARFTAALPNGTRVSMKDVYQFRSVRRLGRALDEANEANEQSSASPIPDPSPDLGPATGTPRYGLCGAVQLLAFAALVCLAAAVIEDGAEWVGAGRGIGGVVGRAIVFGAAFQAGLAALPVLAKWLLIGRWKPCRINVWSMVYLRFWIVKTLLASSVLARLSVGTAFYGIYLRALGAKVGRGSVVFTRHAPVCTDMITIGSGSVVRKEAFLNGYRARSGVIEIAPVTLGANSFVGERTVLDIGTSLGDGAQLGHSSSLQAGQAVPAGECWHGSPAQPADPEFDYLTSSAISCTPPRRIWYATVRLVLGFLVAGPVEATVAILLVSRPRMFAAIPEWDAVPAAAALYAGLLIAGVAVAGVVPRLLTRVLEPGKFYPLFGFHYTVQRLVARLSNIPALTALFGDSVAITHYLRLLGYRLGQVEQTGSNFGMVVSHEVPALSVVGHGTMVSDGLSFMNADFSASAFRVRPTVVGARTFLGNDVGYPAGARVGDDCLVATKAMVPIAGPLRAGTGLLGSPCFEIPRTVQRDRQFDQLSSGPERQRRIAAKTRHNLVTMALHLLVRFLLLAGIVAVALMPFPASGWRGWAVTAAAIVADLTLTIALFVVAERVLVRLLPLRPRFCSIYQREFWQHERYWKVPSQAYLHLFDGTPFKVAMWRLLGVQMGRRVFDDGCSIVERTLTSVGSETTLNMASVLQCHSLEDGTFKSDRITIGSGCTLGTAAFAHYDVTMEDGSRLEADSFAMKGAHLFAGTQWLGNPAAEVIGTTMTTTPKVEII